jgi:hypothetical protein
MKGNVKQKQKQKHQTDALKIAQNDALENIASMAEVLGNGPIYKAFAMQIRALKGKSK